jgi:hypothetical protein
VLKRFLETTGVRSDTMKRGENNSEEGIFPHSEKLKSHLSLNDSASLKAATSWTRWKDIAEVSAGANAYEHVSTAEMNLNAPDPAFDHRRKYRKQSTEPPHL